MTQDRILVTGAGGFIGYHVSRRLLNEGRSVLCTDCSQIENSATTLRPARLRQLKSEFNDCSRFAYKEANVEKSEQLKAIWSPDIGVVVHLAGRANVRDCVNDPAPYVYTNVVGHFNILDACRHNGVKHLIYASSSSVYGNSATAPFSEQQPCDQPISLYAATKKSMELMSYTYAHVHGLKSTALRFFTVYGPWGRPDMAVYHFTDSIVKDKPIQVYNNGENERSFTYIDDVVKGVVSLIDRPPTCSPPHCIFNIGSDSVASTHYLISLIENALGKKAKVEYKKQHVSDVLRTWADGRKACEQFGYTAKVPLDVGIRAFVDWYRSVADDLVDTV